MRLKFKILHLEKGNQVYFLNSQVFVYALN